jgi:lipoate-protein ligase B
MLFKEIAALYTENHMKQVNTLCRQNAELLIIKAGGTYTYHRALKD